MMYGLLAILVLLVAVWIVKKKNPAPRQEVPEQKPEKQESTLEQPVPEPPAASTPEIPYRRKYLLTKNEWVFYKRLKPIADKYHLHVLCKIRMADLVEPLPTADKSLWYSSFGKIKAKHVDFALANPENLHVLLLLELDDSSHTWDKSRQRDAFVDQVYQKVGIPILHVWGAAGLEEAILGALPSLAQNP